MLCATGEYADDSFEDSIREAEYKKIAKRLKTLPGVDIRGNRWISLSEKLPDKYTKVLVSTYGIVTIGERTSDTNESLRLTILEPMNNMYKNIGPKQYQITHWQPLPKGYER